MKMNALYKYAETARKLECESIDLQDEIEELKVQRRKCSNPEILEMFPEKAYNVEYLDCRLEYLRFMVSMYTDVIERIEEKIFSIENDSED